MGWKNADEGKKYRQRTRQLIRESKEQPCVDCGIQYPFYMMEFDHVRGEKRFELSRAPGRRGIPQVVEEISKCDVVCANCHKARTYQAHLAQ